VKIATWNVNSLRLRLPRLIDWLAANAIDVLCLQETKLEDPTFPRLELEAAGYGCVFTGQRTYNGVAIVWRRELGSADDVVVALPEFADDAKRLIAATIAGIRTVCLYVPNGQSVGSDKYRYKLDWCGATHRYLRDELAAHRDVAVLGDFNIAPEPRDVHDPALWEGSVLFSEPERAQFREWIALGFVDSFRLFEQPPNTFSWWDYRMLAFPKNKGLRIDHVLLSADLARRCTSCRIDRNVRKGDKPSDHAPVVVELAPHGGEAQ
jgi:exodeoxyribonuclease-3